MKKIAIIAILAGLVASGIALAAEKPSIAYVDMRKVLTESKIGKQNRTEMEKLIKGKQATLAKEEQALKAMQQAFQKEQPLLTDTQKKDKEKEFQGKAEAYQKAVAEAKQLVSQKGEDLSTKVSTDIKGVVSELAKELKLSLVFGMSDTTDVLYAEEGMDLTQKVIQKYDAKAK